MRSGAVCLQTYLSAVGALQVGRVAHGFFTTLCPSPNPPALACSLSPRVCACMQTQHKVQLDHRDANPGSIPPPMPGMVPPGEPHASLPLLVSFARI